MTTEIYDLKKLCVEAGITPRTVHFYIQQGLLPPAGSHGPGARYDRGHLARLKLIKLLQKEHLPLSEIRLRIESLDDAKVQSLVTEYSSQKPPANSSAVEYIRSVLTGKRHMPPHSAAGNLLEKQPVELLSEAPAFYCLRSRSVERSQWERIGLTPDVELHIRRPLLRSQNKKIEALIQHAREILKEE
jgi:DNA-binding transcriptional MerR regulator